MDRARRHWPELEFTADVAPVDRARVPARLDRAVNNLLDNAGKFIAAGGQVEVALFADGRLTVRDHGPGIPRATCRMSSTVSTAAAARRGLPGSGLGLAIVAQVAESHGGTVSLPPTLPTAGRSPSCGCRRCRCPPPSSS